MGRQPPVAAGQSEIYSFRGGFVRGIAGANPIFRLVRLSLYSTGLRITPVTRLLGFLVPTWEARYDELPPVRVVGGGWMRGPRFEFRDRGLIRFVPGAELNEVLAALRDVGVEVIA
jgi:hypothetical protein